MNDGLPLLDAVEVGMSLACELNYCADGVGPFGKVNEEGDITQDAMLMDGSGYLQHYNHMYWYSYTLLYF